MHEPPRLDALSHLRALAAGRVPAVGPIETGARVRFAVAQALAQGRLGFHFQPVVRADAPRFPAFFEMLARLALPDGHLLPAAAFLPHVEDGPLGRAVDRAALAAACAALADDPALRLAVNMSPRSMGDAGWLAILAEAAARDRRVPARLILEITETAAIADAGLTRDFMGHVRGYGCAFAIDDFGAGATGFRHFRELRFDIVKIDGAFAQGVGRSPDARVLVECLVRVARHFEMTTVAERVECDDDAEALGALGVDCLQGYRFGRPAARPVLAPEEPRRRAG
jgi:EAL domain-containing protein (putative c-di-GMP-specific phosphodiesterase class I)